MTLSYLEAYLDSSKKFSPKVSLGIVQIDWIKGLRKPTLLNVKTYLSIGFNFLRASATSQAPGEGPKSLILSLCILISYAVKTRSLEAKSRLLFSTANLILSWLFFLIANFDGESENWISESLAGSIKACASTDQLTLSSGGPKSFKFDMLLRNSNSFLDILS